MPSLFLVAVRFGLWGRARRRRCSGSPVPGASIGSIGPSGRGAARRRASGNVYRAVSLSLIALVVALSLLSVHLATQVHSKGGKRPATNPEGSVGRGDDRVGDEAPSAASSASQGRRAEDVVVTPQIIAAPYPDGPKTDPKYAKDRVYCMVPYVWNREFYDVIMQTWGKRCNVIQFLTDSQVLVGGVTKGDNVFKDPTGGYKHHSELPEGTFPDNVVFINMTRPWMGCKDPKTGKPKVCRHIWEKMWRSWIYVGDHHLNDAEWFCKVDYDTFFFPENLQYFVRDVKGWDAYNEHRYFGTVLYHRESHGRPPMAAGAAACWSHKTMAGIAEVYRKMPKGHQGGDRGRCEDRPEASEEVSTSMCLKKELNVIAEPMVDEEMREYIMLDPIHNMLTWNRTEQGEWWFWKGKPKNAGQMEDCCAIRPVGIHKYKQSILIEQLDKQFYGPADGKDLKRLNARTRRYADKVRRAMGISK